jgi:hypothetical protein
MRAGPATAASCPVTTPTLPEENSVIPRYYVNWRNDFVVEIRKVVLNSPNQIATC